MDILIDGIFGGLIDAVDPLGMVLRTLMVLLADALAQVATGMYTSLFEITTIDFGDAALGSIWRITTGISVSVAMILLVIAAFRSMLAQSTRHVMTALPGVVLAILGPQAMSILLPSLALGFTSLANTIVETATPDLAESIRLLAGVGPNPIYEGLGLMAPLIAALLLFGLSIVFFVLMLCMAVAVVLYALSPLAFAGLVMPATRSWFTKWATAMFAVLFAKVPIAILLALSVALFANSANSGTAQAFVNAGAGLVLGVGALLSPVMAYGLFSFMGTVATQPTMTSVRPSRALGSAYYGTQMGRAGVNGLRSAVGRIPGVRGSRPGPHEPTASARAGGAKVGTGSSAARRHATTSAAARSAGHGPAAASSSVGGTAAGGAAPAGTAATAGTAAVAGAATAGVGAAVVVGAHAARRAGSKAKSATTSMAASLAAPTGFVERDSGLLVPDSKRTRAATGQVGAHRQPAAPPTTPR